jgi:hypothetical protein
METLVYAIHLVQVSRCNALCVLQERYLSAQALVNLAQQQGT